MLAAIFSATTRYAFDDGQTLQRRDAGRAVQTDSRGDGVFSELRGEPVAAGRRVAGTITGGTGRYAGVHRWVHADVGHVRRVRMLTMSFRGAQSTLWKNRLRKGAPVTEPAAD